MIFLKGFLLNCEKKVFFDLKSWGPLKNIKTRIGSLSGLGRRWRFKYNMLSKKKSNPPPSILIRMYNSSYNKVYSKLENWGMLSRKVPRSLTVKILRTPCCTQVTKTKDSYLYQKPRSAVTTWRAGDWVTARELNVLASDCG
jgi:hypothetical protein